VALQRHRLADAAGALDCDLARRQDAGREEDGRSALAATTSTPSSASAPSRTNRVRSIRSSSCGADSRARRCAGLLGSAVGRRSDCSGCAFGPVLRFDLLIDPAFGSGVTGRSSATVHGAAVTDIDDHNAGLVVLDGVDDPPVADSDPQ
jgi:hypothetical protein